MSTKKLQVVGQIVATDDTLTQSGVAADAKVVGDLWGSYPDDNDVVNMLEQTGVSMRLSDETGALLTDEDGAVLTAETTYRKITDVEQISSLQDSTTMFVNDNGALKQVPITDVLVTNTETDPTVPAWAKASTKPTYTAQEVGALPDTTAIPSIEGLATETYVDTKIGNKVDKVDGKGLSTNDYTNEEKEKLANISINSGSSLSTYTIKITITSESSGSMKITLSDGTNFTLPIYKVTPYSNAGDYTSAGTRPIFKLSLSINDVIAIDSAWASLGSFYQNIYFYAHSCDIFKVIIEDSSHYIHGVASNCCIDYLDGLCFTCGTAAYRFTAETYNIGGAEEPE